jgi:hypothetical protein
VYVIGLAGCGGFDWFAVGSGEFFGSVIFCVSQRKSVYSRRNGTRVLRDMADLNSPSFDQVVALKENICQPESCLSI